MTKSAKIAIICSACAIPVIAVSVTVPLVLKAKKSVTVKEISIGQMPTKTWYKPGDKLTFAGLKVNALMSDNSTRELGADEYITSVNQGEVLSEENDDFPIEIYYKSKTKVYKDIKATFSIKIGPTIEVTANSKWLYQAGDALDLSGLVVTAKISKDKTVTLELDKDYTVSPAQGTILQPTEDNIQPLLITYIANPEITADSYVIVGAQPKEFKDASWKEIHAWCSIYEIAKGYPGTEVEFLRHFKKLTMDDFIGTEHDLLINGTTTHKVRIIGVEQDSIFGGSYSGRKAVFTFQLSNQVLTNPQGVEYKSVYDRITSQEYPDSILLNNLYNPDPSYEANWANLPSENKTVYQMLPLEVQEAIKPVLKYVRTEQTKSTETPASYNTKVFILTRQEMLGKDDTFLDAGTQYSYWKTHTEDSHRIMKTVADSPAAVNYATCSPLVSDWSRRSIVLDSGAFHKRYSVTTATAISPCFSI